MILLVHANMANKYLATPPYRTCQHNIHRQPSKKYDSGRVGELEMRMAIKPIVKGGEERANDHDYYPYVV